MLNSLVQRLEDFKERIEGNPQARAKLQRESTYATYVEAAVVDGVLTSEELAYLGKIRIDLGIDVEAAERILQQKVTQFFKARINSVDYATPDDAAALIKTLHTALKGLKLSWADVKKSLRREMLAYLGRVLDAQWADNVMDKEEIKVFQTICEKFGLHFAEVTGHYAARLQRHIEDYTSTQVASDDLTQQDLDYVDQMCSLFGLTEHVRQRLTSEIERQFSLAAVRRGEFLNYRSPILLDSSEKCIFASHGAQFVPMGKSMEKASFGVFVVSDRKLYFVPEDGGQRTLMLKRVLKIQPSQGGFAVQGNKKNASGVYFVAQPDLALETLYTAVMIEKRHMLPGEDADRTRHIPQAVRHSVWHRDGGRCVQCGATQHLHFDHIIPFSRGGANTVENVQLLCVSCNLEKSDRI